MCVLLYVCFIVGVVLSQGSRHTKAFFVFRRRRRISILQKGGGEKQKMLSPPRGPGNPWEPMGTHGYPWEPWDPPWEPWDPPMGALEPPMGSLGGAQAH